LSKELYSTEEVKRVLVDINHIPSDLREIVYRKGYNKGVGDERERIITILKEHTLLAKKSVLLLNLIANIEMTDKELEAIRNELSKVE